MMDCPYMEFWYDGNYGCELTGGECEGLPCDIASEFEDNDEQDYDE